MIYKDGTNAVQTTTALGATYGFTAQLIYEAAFPGFFGPLNNVQVAALRCEAAVKLIEQNAEVLLP